MSDGEGGSSIGRRVAIAAVLVGWGAVLAAGLVGAPSTAAPATRYDAVRPISAVEMEVAFPVFLIALNLLFLAAAPKMTGSLVGVIVAVQLPLLLLYLVLGGG